MTTKLGLKSSVAVLLLRFRPWSWCLQIMILVSILVFVKDVISLRTHPRNM